MTTFRSKSARTQQRSLPKPVQVSLERSLKDCILWTDADNVFFKMGTSFGFKCIVLADQDLSIICSAACVIIMSDTPKALAAQRFACEYGVPLIWYHENFAPDEKTSRCFRQILIGKVSMYKFWGCVCQVVQQ